MAKQEAIELERGVKTLPRQYRKKRKRVKKKGVWEEHRSSCALGEWGVAVRQLKKDGKLEE